MREEPSSRGNCQSKGPVVEEETAARQIGWAMAERGRK